MAATTAESLKLCPRLVEIQQRIKNGDACEALAVDGRSLVYSGALVRKVGLSSHARLLVLCTDQLSVFGGCDKEGHGPLKAKYTVPVGHFEGVFPAPKSKKKKKFVFTVKTDHTKEKAKWTFTAPDEAAFCEWKKHLSSFKLAAGGEAVASGAGDESKSPDSQTKKEQKKKKKTEDGGASLHMLVAAGSLEVVRERVMKNLRDEEKLDVNAVDDEKKQTPLHVAVRAGNEPITWLLLRARPGPDLEKRDGDGRTVAELAIAAGNASLLRVLLAAGADPESCDERKQSLLKSVLVSDSLTVKGKLLSEMVGVLVTAGAAVDAIDVASNLSLLQLCCQVNRPKATRALLKFGATHGFISNEGRAAIHYAAATGSIQCARALLDYGSGVNCRDMYRNTPLHVSDAVAMHELLILYGARTELLNAKGERGDIRLSKPLSPRNSAALVRAKQKFASKKTAKSDGKVRLRDEGWLADKESNKCLLCDVKFSLFFRRHHCRRCGMLCCALCSTKKFFVPSVAQTKLKEVRCCDSCFAVLMSVEVDAAASHRREAHLAWQRAMNVLKEPVAEVGKPRATDASGAGSRSGPRHEKKGAGAGAGLGDTTDDDEDDDDEDDDSSDMDFAEQKQDAGVLRSKRGGAAMARSQAFMKEREEFAKRKQAEEDKLARKTALAHGPGRFDKRLEQQKEKTSKFREAEAAKKVMQDNVRLARENVDKLDELADKSAKLEDGAQNFAGLARQLKKQQRARARGKKW